MKGPVPTTDCVATAQPPEDDLDWEEDSTLPGIASTRHVLVVEDDSSLRELMARQLAFEGYFVTEASDAQAMLEAVQSSCESCQNTFDLIVTDVRMPGMTGLIPNTVRPEWPLNTALIIGSH